MRKKDFEIDMPLAAFIVAAIVALMFGIAELIRALGEVGLI